LFDYFLTSFFYNPVNYLAYSSKICTNVIYYFNLICVPGYQIASLFRSRCQGQFIYTFLPLPTEVPFNSKAYNTSDAMINPSDVISTDLRLEHWRHLWESLPLVFDSGGLFRYT